MKIILAILICSTLLFSCGPSDTWWYGDIDLGDDYYYMVEPAFNSIQTLETEDSLRTNGYVLREISSIGFNQDFIAATTKNNDRWIIDKNYNSSLLEKYPIKEELIGPIDSTEFYDFIFKQEIKLKTSEQYQKDHGWK